MIMQANHLKYLQFSELQAIAQAHHIDAQQLFIFIQRHATCAVCIYWNAPAIQDNHIIIQKIIVHTGIDAGLLMKFLNGSISV